MHCMVVLLVVAASAARADDGLFYLQHMELRRLVVAVEGGQPATAGKALIAHYTKDPTTDALMFKEDPMTQSIRPISVDHQELCITDNSGTPPLISSIILLMSKTSQFETVCKDDRDHITKLSQKK